MKKQVAAMFAVCTR